MRDDVLAPEGQFVDHRDIEVAVDGLVQRLRNRRRRSEKKVRVGARSLLAERRALANPEAVLLVDDRETEPLEGDVLLDERVRAHGDGDRSIGKPREDFAPPVAGHARGQERVRGASVREECGERPRVLLREELGRCHKRGLCARCGRDPRGERGDDRFSGPDIALQEPRHRDALPEIRADIF